MGRRPSELARSRPPAVHRLLQWLCGGVSWSSAAPPGEPPPCFKCSRPFPSCTTCPSWCFRQWWTRGPCGVSASRVNRLSPTAAAAFALTAPQARASAVRAFLQVQHLATAFTLPPPTQPADFAQDDVIWSPQDAAGDITVVIYGLVQTSFTDHHGRLQEYFLGSGGLVGLLPALTGEVLPGAGPAVAQRSSMHRGPVCFTIPQAVVRALRRRAAAGDRALQQLELDMFRVAALYVVDRTKGDVGAELAAQYHRAVAASRPPGGRRQRSPNQPQLPAEGKEEELPADVAGLGGPPPPPHSAGRVERERRSDRSAIAFSHRVLADIRHQLRVGAPWQWKQRVGLMFRAGKCRHAMQCMVPGLRGMVSVNAGCRAGAPGSWGAAHAAWPYCAPAGVN